MNIRVYYGFWKMKLTELNWPLANNHKRSLKVIAKAAACNKCVAYIMSLAFFCYSLSWSTKQWGKCAFTVKPLDIVTSYLYHEVKYLYLNLLCLVLSCESVPSLLGVRNSPAAVQPQSGVRFSLKSHCVIYSRRKEWIDCVQ